MNPGISFRLVVGAVMEDYRKGPGWAPACASQPGLMPRLGIGLVRFGAPLKVRVRSGFGQGQG